MNAFLSLFDLSCCLFHSAFSSLAVMLASLCALDLHQAVLALRVTWWGLPAESPWCGAKPLFWAALVTPSQQEMFYKLSESAGCMESPFAGESTHTCVRTVCAVPCERTH